MLVSTRLVFPSQSICRNTSWHVSVVLVKNYLYVGEDTFATVQVRPAPARAQPVRRVQRSLRRILLPASKR